MKILQLIRHAKSARDLPVDDFYRPLNQRGIHDALTIGQWLKENSIMDGKIYCSPSLRTVSTACILSRVTGWNMNEIVWEKRIYEASVDDLIEIITQTDNHHQTITIIGHNPSLHDLIELLIHAGWVKFPTCAVAIISFENARSWIDIFKTQGVLIKKVFPKNL